MASANFNSADEDSWYFGRLSRKETQDRLLRLKHGTFLVRDSTTCPGDFVLSVSENSKVSHYIINKMDGRLKIGDQVFNTMPELLDFYKIHYLDTTTLIEPIARSSRLSMPTNNHQSYPPAGPSSNGPPLMMGYDAVDGPLPKQNSMSSLPILVRALFDFKSDDPDDLPFSKGEILEVVEKPEENWWNARNSAGRLGQIPVPYVEVHVPNRNSMPGAYQFPGVTQQQRPLSMPSANDPVFAEVVTRRVPNAYDPTALALEVGDIIKVTSMNKNGQWQGECNNKQGWFPFTHVKVIETKKS